MIADSHNTIRLAAMDDYDAWHRMHVSPSSKGGRDDDLENLALSCKTCNFLKRNWLPEGYESMSRDDRVKIVRRHIQQLRAKKQQAVAEMRLLARQLLDLKEQEVSNWRPLRGIHSR